MQQPRFICLLAEHTKFSPLRPSTGFSVAIRVVCCNRYSHYSILFENEEGELWVIESTWPEVKAKPYAEWYAHANRIVLPQFLDESIWPFDLGAVLALEGTPYPVKDIIDQILDIARTNWLGIGHRWNGNSGKVGRPGTFCTELAATGMGRKDSHRIRPNDFYSPLGIIGITNGEEFRTFRGQEAVLPQFVMLSVNY